jgi:hypothetical protein
MTTMGGHVRPDAGAGPEENQGGAMRGERRYDSFVVRLWRQVGQRRLLRVEVEHTQGNGVVRARGVEVDWIGGRIADLLEERPAPESLQKGR